MADEIINGLIARQVEPLQAEIKRLRKALEKIEHDTGPMMIATNHSRGDMAHEIARRALEKS